MLKSTSVEVDFLFLEEARVKSLKAATPPNLPLASTSGDYNSHAGKGEGLVLGLQIILLTMQHHRVLQVDSEYSPRLLQNDVGNAPNSPQQRTALPLDNDIQMLGKLCREKGELEGVGNT